MKTTSFVALTVVLIGSAAAQTPAPPADAPRQAPSKPSTEATTGSERGGVPKRLVYVKPKTAATGTRVDGDGGSRGDGLRMPSIQVLTPNHTGLTTQAQPSLFWHQGGPAGARVELTIIEPKKPKPILQVRADAAGGPGIHRLPLAKYNVTLVPGTLYKWTIALVPDPANRSQDVIASGTIQRTEPDAAFTTELTAAEGLQKAALYAGKGFWYDALEVVTNEIDAAPKDKALRLQRATLLEQAGLKDAAAAERK